MADPDLLGSAWLAEHFDIHPVQPLAVRSEMGGRRSTLTLNDQRVETYQASARVDLSPAAHINFMLKHEGVPLELLARVFDRMDPEDLAGWSRAEPTGQYLIARDVRERSRQRGGWSAFQFGLRSGG